MEARVDRTERAFAPIASPEVHDILQLLRVLKIRVLRCRSKIDALKSSDIGDLSEIIQEIRAFTSVPDLEFKLTQSEYQGRIAREVLAEEAAYLRNLSQGMLIGLQLTADGLHDLLPAQKPAAFRFAFDNDNDRVVVANEPFRPTAKEAEVALAALDEIIVQATEAVEDLNQSNAAPRLKAAFSRLKERLSSYRNIVQVGQCNQAASRMLKAYVEELSAPQFEQMRALVEGVSAVLAQFAEWRQFCESAAQVALDDAAIAEIRADTLVLAQQLKRSAHASEDVPRALEEVAEWVNEDAQPDKRDALSLVRTLENFWSLLTRNALAKAVKEETSKVIARGIIFVAITAVSAGFAANISRIPGAEWIEATFAYVKANLQSFGVK
ncbi:hypothetical protein B5K08_09895 [Rhizobium leguminosarum bv. trifolii]|uniref:Uncharacterized protein n=2 Tax=Rhizobium leguminosarum TaxID=384 RepID=A0A3E1BQ15_RHILT|nr:hypothetical protein B5K08_09895 [Rhizobium leguminosarum bv. trifolii]RFB95858.1 hypothetical protein B5K10_09880 [Rhizobium leguminosarum bv. trifolii]